MSHCLKEFIKERLYGNMINYTRKTDEKNARFTPFINSIPDEETLSNARSASSIKTEQQRRLSEAR